MRQRSVLGSGVSGYVISAIFLPWFYISTLRLSGNWPDVAHFSKVFATFPFFAFSLLMSVFRHFSTIWIALRKERLWFLKICCAANCENVWTADHFICKFSALPWLAAGWPQTGAGAGWLLNTFKSFPLIDPNFALSVSANTDWQIFYVFPNFIEEKRRKTKSS